MPTEHKYATRLVIQRIGYGSSKFWRVIGYGGKRAMGHADFGSTDALGSAIRSAIPEFDPAVLSDSPIQDAPSIAYCEDVELNYAQLSHIGLG